MCRDSCSAFILSRMAHIFSVPWGRGCCFTIDQPCHTIFWFFQNSFRDMSSGKSIHGTFASISLLVRKWKQMVERQILRGLKLAWLPIRPRRLSVMVVPICVRLLKYHSMVVLSHGGVDVVINGRERTNLTICCTGNSIRRNIG